MDNYEQVNRVNLQFLEVKLEGAFASLRVSFEKIDRFFLNVPTTILSCAAKQNVRLRRKTGRAKLAPTLFLSDERSSPLHYFGPRFAAG